MDGEAMAFEGVTEQAPKEDEGVAASAAATQELDSLRLPTPPLDEAQQQQHEDPLLDPTDVLDSPEPYIYVSPTDTEDYKRSYALNFSLRKKPKCLFAMALGMPEFYGILDRPPLSILKRKELTDLYFPKADDFKHEIKRRSHFFMGVPEEASYFIEELKREHPLKTKRSNIVLPQPNQWLNSSLRTWLLERPMNPNDSDVNFLRLQLNQALDYLNKENNTEGAEVKPEPETPKAPTTPIAGVITSPPLFGSTSYPMVGEIPTVSYTYASGADSEEFKRSSAVTFVERDGKPRILIAMALGMVEYQDLLDRPPLSIVKRKDLADDYIPRAEDYRFEIKRRAHFFMNVEEETQYFTRELKRKNPLENMRGIIHLPQPNQWKLQALKAWLYERPFKPNKQDSTFLHESIKTFLDALAVVLQNEPQATETPGKKSSGKGAWKSSDADSEGSNEDGPESSKRRETLLLECISKQDAILGAVTKQTQQQTILNKVTVLNQAITGYQQEISSLRSTLNDMDNRILTVEMRIAEAPESEQRLSLIVAKQQEAKNGNEAKLKELQQLILENRTKIEVHTNEMDALEVVDSVGSVHNSRKRKLEDDETGEVGNDAGDNGHV
jgi:hypothetical protein